MNDTLKALSAVIPTIATALGGPLAGIAAKFVTDKLGLSTDTSPSAVTAVLSGMDPTALKEFSAQEFEFKTKLAELGYANLQAIEEVNAKVVLAVNETMKTEATSEHWPTYSWRPFIGFSFGAYITSLWLLPLFHVTPVIMNPDIVMAIGGILGVASYFRGKAQADSAASNTNLSNKG